MLIDQRIRNVDGIGSGCRRMEQYSEDMIAHMLAVGSSPGAGNRSHISDALSEVCKGANRITMYLITRRHMSLNKFSDVYILHRVTRGPNLLVF